MKFEFLILIFMGLIMCVKVCGVFVLFALFVRFNNVLLVYIFCLRTWFISLLCIMLSFVFTRIKCFIIFVQLKDTKKSYFHSFVPPIKSNSKYSSSKKTVTQ